MATNLIQIKRTSVTGRAANSTTLTNPGELALNMTDGIMYSTNGTSVFEIGANNTNQRVSGILTVNAISANGGVGTSGQVLKTNGTTAYWDTAAGSGTVTSIATANGLSGGTITTTGTLGVTTGSTLTVNTTGIHVNSALAITSLAASSNVQVGTVGAGNGAFVSNSLIFVGNNTVYSNITPTGIFTSTGTFAGAVSGITTLAAGNTTVTGFANVTSTIQGGSSLTIAGAASGITTLAAGNTTITGFANVSTTLQVGTNTATFGTAAYIVANGNIGIGTASPAAPLHISSTNINSYGAFVASAIGVTKVGNGARGALVDFGVGGGLFSNWYYNSSLDKAAATGYSPRIDLWVSDGSIRFLGSTSVAADATIAWSERMRIDAGGNVMVGTTATNNRFLVTYSNPVSVPSAGAGGHGIAIGTVGYGLAGGVRTDGTSYLQSTRWDGTATNYNLLLQPNGGNVGVGNTAPAHVLSVTGTTNLGGAVTGITTLAAGNTTITGFANVTSTIQGGSSLTIAGAASGITTLAAGNTSITGFANVSTSVNSAALTVGTSFIANTSRVVIGTAVGLEANGGIGTAGQVLHSNGTTAYWAADDDTNTTYDLLAVANTAVNAGLLRLADVNNSNDTVTFTGTGTSNVSSNATHIIINSADQYVGTVTSVATANGLSGGTITSSGTLGVTTGSTLTVNTTGIHVNSALSIASLALSGDLTVTGNLTVSGTRTYVNTTTLDIGDNIFTLNADLGAVAPSQDAGIEIMRGTSANVQFLWDETNDRWSTNSQPLAISSLIAAGAASGITTLAAGNTTITGFANVTSTLQVGGGSTFGGTVTLGSVGLSSNGSLGTAGHVLHSNGTATYWAADDNSGGTVTSIATANGLTGGTITTTGTLGVASGSTLTVNTAGIHVNSTLSITSLTLAGALSGVTTAAMGNTTHTGWVTASSARGAVFAPTAGQNNSALYVTGSDTAYGLLFGADPASGKGWIQSQRTDGTGTTYALKLNPTGGGVEFAGAASGITTLAAGNTTITGFANVTSTIQGGSSLSIAGALSGVTTAAMGNTTITGFANVSTTLQVGGVATFAANANFDSGAFFVDGTNNRVGINTTAPQSRMQIFGSNAPETGDAASTETMLTLTREGSATVWREGASFALGRWQTGGGSNPFSRLDINLKSVTDNSSLPNVTVMSLQDSGQVGVGTITPQYSLDVNPGLTTNNISASFGSTITAGQYAGIHFGYSEAANQNYRKSAIVFEREDGSARGKIHILNDGAADGGSAVLSDSKVTITYDGNMGIGNTAPASKLVVGGVSGSVTTPTAIELDNSYGSTPGFDKLKLYLLKTGSETYGFGLGANADVQYWAGSSSTGNHRFYTSQTERMTLIANGNLGIGTTTPGVYKLNVNGQSYFADTINLAAGSGGMISWTTGYSDGTTLTFQSPTSGSIALIANGTAGLFIKSNQNVGIGTTTPGYKLEVNGSFAATTKSFVIPHPTKPDMKLRYGSLEGPENGVYVRGRLKAGEKIIQLPDYWEGLVDQDTYTVNLTPIGKHQELFVEHIASDHIIVGGENIDCFYTVFAERNDVEKLVVEF